MAMTHVHGEVVTPTDMWIRMCVLMALGQLHSIPDPLVQTKQHLENLVPRYPWLAQLPQHHSARPSWVSNHTTSGSTGKGEGQSQAG